MKGQGILRVDDQAPAAGRWDWLLSSPFSSLSWSWIHDEGDSSTPPATKIVSCPYLRKWQSVWADFGAFTISTLHAAGSSAHERSHPAFVCRPSRAMSADSTAR